MSNENENTVAQIYHAILFADGKAGTANSEIEKLRAEVKQVGNQSQSAIAQAKKRNQSEIDRINAQHHSEIENIRSRPNERISTLRNQFAKLARLFYDLDVEKHDHSKATSNFTLFPTSRITECDGLMSSIDDQKRQLESTILAWEQQAQILVDTCERNAQIPKKIKAVNEQIQNEIAALEEQTRSKVKAFLLKAMETRNYFTDNWDSYLQPLNALCQQIRSQQPILSDIQPKTLNATSGFPSGIVFGRWHLTLPAQFQKDVDLNDWQGFVPNLVEFPFPKPLYGTFGNMTDTQRVHQLLLRLLFALPIGMLDVTIIDPVKLGVSIEDFLPLLKIEKLIPKKRCLTHAEETTEALLELVNYSTEMLQQRFQGKFTSWMHYNHQNQEKPLPYKLLLIFGFPEQFSDKSINYLKRILENGAKFGILPVILSDKSKIQEASASPISERKRIVDEIQNMLASQGQHISDVLFSSYLQLLCVDHKPEPLPNNLPECLNGITQAYLEHEESKKVSKTIEDMWPTELFGESSKDGISTPIGWNAEGQEIAFTLGARQDSEHHALLAGRAGTGKSNVLHVLIHGLLHRYGVEELNLYLLDYKEGVEINVYAKTALPQIKLVATESDREYGVTVLEHLCAELKHRNDFFKQKGKTAQETRSLYEYRDVTAEKLPRILVIIDEFQVLIEADDSITKRAIECFTTLLKQGRSSGIHVLLATQTLKGLHSSGTSGSFGPLFTQIGCRIALSCGEEDSQLILSNSNSEAVRLKGKGDGIINNSNGQKSGNLFFDVPYADPKNTQLHLGAIAKTAHQKGDVTNTKVFNGTNLPEFLPKNFSIIKETKIPQIMFGEELNFSANPFSFQWERRAGCNLCIAGLDDSIRQGMLWSLFECVQQNNMFDNIVYFNTDPYKTLQLPDINGLVRYDSTWEGNMSEWTSEYLKEKRSLLIINALDDANARMFHPKPIFGVKKDISVTPAESLKILLDEGPRHGSFVIAFVDNWNNFNTACKDYLNANLFDLRIGFRLNEEDAGSLVHGSVSGKRIKGLDDGRKAIFVNRSRNTQTLFRPFVIPTEE